MAARVKFVCFQSIQKAFCEKSTLVGETEVLRYPNFCEIEIKSKNGFVFKLRNYNLKKHLNIQIINQFGLRKCYYVKQS